MIWAFLMLDWLCILLPVRRKANAIVLRLDGFGDFFIWMKSGAINASRYARSGGRRAVLIANSFWAPYARTTGLWDEVVDLDPRRFQGNPLYRLRLLARIRFLGAEVLIQPRAARVFLHEDAIARVCGARLRIGNSGTLLNSTAVWRRRGNCFYEQLVKVDERKDTHESVRNAQFARGLTGEQDVEFPFCAQQWELQGRAPIVVVLGAGQAGRVWPIENLSLLVQHIVAGYPDSPIVLLGTTRDRESARTILRDLGEGRISDQVGNTSLPEYVNIVAGARLVVCNDSSAFHVATAYKRRVLCFLGGGHYGWFAPYPPEKGGRTDAIVLDSPMSCYWCNWRCIYPRGAEEPFRCVSSIPLTRAIQAVDTLLS
jgi:ADP-heptose:LPS heptosyltransferase